jgi:hypothetical protein
MYVKQHAGIAQVMDLVHNAVERHRTQVLAYHHNIYIPR